MSLIQRDAQVQHTAVEYNGFALLDKSEGLFIQNIPVKMNLSIVGDGYMDHIAETETSLIERIDRDIGIQISKMLHCIRNDALGTAGLHIGIEEGVMQNHFTDGLFGADTFKIDYTGGQLTCAIGKQVAAMEDGRALRALQAVDVFIDLPDGFNADLIVHMGQCAVIGGHHIAAVLQLRHTGAAAGADTGVNHADKNGACGPEGDNIHQRTTGLPSVKRSDIVGQVGADQFVVNRGNHTFHSRCTHIINAKVGH